MGGGEYRAHLSDDGRGPRHRHRHDLGDQVGDRHAAHVLDDHEQLALIGAEVVEDRDARVAESRGDPSLAVESAHRGGVPALARADQLDHYLAVEAPVGAFPECAHAARRDRCHQLVAAEDYPHQAGGTVGRNGLGVPCHETARESLARVAATNSSERACLISRSYRSGSVSRSPPIRAAGIAPSLMPATSICWYSRPLNRCSVPTWTASGLRGPSAPIEVARMPWSFSYLSPSVTWRRSGPATPI